MNSKTANCCHIECKEPAEWVIFRMDKTIDNDAHACEAHVGALLSDAREHRIFPIADAMFPPLNGYTQEGPSQ